MKKKESTTKLFHPFFLIPLDVACTNFCLFGYKVIGLIWYFWKRSWSMMFNQPKITICFDSLACSFIPLALVVPILPKCYLCNYSV